MTRPGFKTRMRRLLDGWRDQPDVLMRARVGIHSVPIRGLNEKDTRQVMAAGRQAHKGQEPS